MIGSAPWLVNVRDKGGADRGTYLIISGKRYGVVVLSTIFIKGARTVIDIDTSNKYPYQFDLSTNALLMMENDTDTIYLLKNGELFRWSTLTTMVLI